MPELMFDSLDVIPEGLRETATQKDGKFQINVVPASKLAEFRDNNIALARERDGLKAYQNTLAPLVGEDPAAFATRFGELAALEQSVKDGKLKGSDAISAEVTNRVAQMKTDYERQLAEQAKGRQEAEAKATAADMRYRRSIVERAVTEAVINDKSGALPSALPDILGRAFGVFQVTEDGKLIAKDGEAVIYGADGATPMSPMEWMGKLREQAPYFFKGSNGGGASGANGGAGQFGGYSREDFAKLSPQQKLAVAHQMKLKGATK